MKLNNKIKVVAFDADDTLWDNEIYFREVEESFTAMFEDYLPSHSSLRELLKTEIANMELYGYGIKAFILSLIETGINITNGNLKSKDVSHIISLGKEMLNKPVTLLPDVEETIKELQNHYKLIVATKGDLLDQRRKLHKSGLGKYFHHIEVMTEKTQIDYRDLIKRLEIESETFFMIGNSLKSDVLPVIEIGGYAAHIPYHTTWELERVDKDIHNENFFPLQSIKQVLDILT